MSCGTWAVTAHFEDLPRHPQLMVFSVPGRPPQPPSRGGLHSTSLCPAVGFCPLPVPTCLRVPLGLSPWWELCKVWCTVTRVESCPSHVAGLLRTETRGHGWAVLDPRAPGQFLVHSKCSINVCYSQEYPLFSVTQNPTRHHGF